jgi:electron transfer flavoprotein beta subunit
MDIIVCIKQIVDLKQLRIQRETREPILEGLPWVISDTDKNALEAAVHLKEAVGGTVTVLSLGATPRLKETMKEALAMGADSATLIIDPALDGNGPAATAQVLARAIQKIGRYDLLLLGEASADNYTGQVGPRLAELLGLPQVTFAIGVEPVGGALQVTRSLEDSLEIVEAPLPALVTVLSEINEPRIPALTQILRAGRKPVTEWQAADLGLSGAPAPLTQVVRNVAPMSTRKGQTFTGDDAVDQLVDALMREGVVIQTPSPSGRGTG